MSNLVELELEVFLSPGTVAAFHTIVDLLCNGLDISVCQLDAPQHLLDYSLQLFFANAVGWAIVCVAAIINKPLLYLTSHRVLTIGALEQPSIGVVVPGHSFDGLAGLDVLDSFKKRYRNQWFVNAGVAGTRGVYAYKARVEWVVENTFHTTFGNGLVKLTS